jgi:hypothetical protein
VFNHPFIRLGEDMNEQQKMISHNGG